MMVKRTIFLLNLFLCLTAYGATGSIAYAQKVIQLESGQKIILLPDGTWEDASRLLFKGKPYRMNKPPFKERLAGSSKKVKPIILKKILEETNNITDLAAWFKNNQLNLNFCRPPASNSLFLDKLWKKCPNKLPHFYKGRDLRSAFFSDQNYFLVYGHETWNGRFLLIADRNLTKVEYELDFENYLISPSYLEKDKRFIKQKVKWAQIVDNILYVSHTHSTYSKSSKGHNAYITAINLDTYQLIWRSRPLLANADNFVVIGDVIVSGYGFTQEPDFLYQINRFSGEVLAKIPLKSAPDYIIRKRNKLFVRSYNTDYIFEFVSPRHAGVDE